MHEGNCKGCGRKNYLNTEYLCALCLRKIEQVIKELQSGSQIIFKPVSKTINVVGPDKAETISNGLFEVLEKRKAVKKINETEYHYINEAPK